MILFYAPEITENATLPRDEAQHCLRVLRLKKGDMIDVTDGKGNFYRAEIAEASLLNCRIAVIETLPQAKLWKGFLEIAVAPAKNIDRTEWFAEKAVEIGIDRISFLHCRCSERKELKTERIRRVMIAAMKQSLKARLPEISELCNFNKFISQKFEGQRFIAHCHDGEKLLLSKIYSPLENVQIFIGPEGDFTTEEVQLAVKQGFVPVSLGENRLRTETAALVACQTVNLINQIMQ
jgi:16S rRNA (uracil1498-N3)-methyltransferase